MSVAVESPLPGKILEIEVSEGDAVEKHDILLVLDAMKMEHEIVAPEAGTVEKIHVAVGATVEVSEVLVTLA